MGASTWCGVATITTSTLLFASSSSAEAWALAPPANAASYTALSGMISAQAVIVSASTRAIARASLSP
jgi:hypothetical protein